MNYVHGKCIACDGFLRWFSSKDTSDDDGGDHEGKKSLNSMKGPVSTFLDSLKCVKLLSHVQLFATPWTVAHQAPLSMGFSRQEHWSGLPFPSLGDLPNLGIEPRSPALQADALSSEPPGKLPLVSFKKKIVYLFGFSNCFRRQLSPYAEERAENLGWDSPSFQTRLEHSSVCGLEQLAWFLQASAPSH